VRRNLAADLAAMEAFGQTEVTRQREVVAETSGAAVRSPPRGKKE